MNNEKSKDPKRFFRGTGGTTWKQEDSMSETDMFLNKLNEVVESNKDFAQQDANIEEAMSAFIRAFEQAEKGE